jgi:hypothetical protein
MRYREKQIIAQDFTTIQEKEGNWRNGEKDFPIYAIHPQFAP